VPVLIIRRWTRSDGCSRHAVSSPRSSEELVQGSRVGKGTWHGLRSASCERRTQRCEVRVSHDSQHSDSLPFLQSVASHSTIAFFLALSVIFALCACYVSMATVEMQRKRFFEAWCCCVCREMPLEPFQTPVRTSPASRVH